MNSSYLEIKDLNRLNTPIDLTQIDGELIEAGVIYYTNVYRQKKNKATLTYNSFLSKAAYTHSDQMQL
ncbi:MAG: CAP domain-containing protein, partial [Candidatus Paceibacterota bacterium]